MYPENKVFFTHFTEDPSKSNSRFKKFFLEIEFKLLTTGHNCNIIYLKERDKYAMSVFIQEFQILQGRDCA